MVYILDRSDLELATSWLFSANMTTQLQSGKSASLTSYLFIHQYFNGPAMVRPIFDLP